jgi:NAD(P)H-hydrate epimerase
MPRYLSQRESQDIDAELMDPARGAFTLQQLMELAGQSVACAIYNDFPPHTHPRINVICGPGNNGGDGLVCARHLQLFGYSPRVILPKPITNEYFKALAAQCRSASVPVEDGVLPSPADFSASTCDAIVDAIFGFSFAGEVREPFASTLRCLHSASAPVISIDIPSGWSVDCGSPPSWSPHALVSTERVNTNLPCDVGTYTVIVGHRIQLRLVRACLEFFKRRNGDLSTCDDTGAYGPLKTVWTLGVCFWTVTVQEDH